MVTPNVRDIDNCDLCIVGAGLAGMNALAVASEYLGRDQRVILIDRRHRVGGMWVDTYPYVRLHQPHSMFTAGDIAWSARRDRGYLANQSEVLDHFQHCLDIIRRRVTVEERFGWDVESYVETDGGVRLICRTTDGRRHVTTTPRLIKAAGFAVTPNDPLLVRSTLVQSVSPNFCDVRQGAIESSDAPVWVIGGGKTGMDTAHALIAADPRREVNMVAGIGGCRPQHSELKITQSRAARLQTPHTVAIRLRCGRVFGRSLRCCRAGISYLARHGG